MWRALPIVIVLLLGDQALACPICFTGRVISIGQKLDAADAAILARPVFPEGSYELLEVIKGDPRVLAPVVTNVTPPPINARALSNTTEQLLFRNRLSGGWTSLGVLPKRHAGWVRELVAMIPAGEPAVRLVKPHGAMLLDEGWLKRLNLVAPHLESANTRAAEIAYGEIMRAPYPELQKLKSALDPGAIARWVADPALAARQPAYTLLLGIAGGPNASATIETLLAAAYHFHDASNLSALLAADLEIRGAARLSWIEQSYLLDRKRTLPEIEAALLALSVQGSEDAVVPRGEIIAAYLRFIDQRKPMAGFVVGDLITWKFWGATEKLVDILRSRVIRDPASRLAIINYLHQSPIPIASAEIEKLSDLLP